MSKRAEIYNNEWLAEYLEKRKDGTYVFRYEEGYFLDPQATGISLSLPKTQREYHSPILFPFFFGILSEGDNKAVQFLWIIPRKYPFRGCR